jgi:hypothetical protein
MAIGIPLRINGYSILRPAAAAIIEPGCIEVKSPPGRRSARAGTARDGVLLAPCARVPMGEMVHRGNRPNGVRERPCIAGI